MLVWRTLVSQRSVICWSLGRLEHPDGARGMERWCNLGVGWLVGWLVKMLGASVEVVKLVFSQVAFVFLMFEVCFFLMFFGNLFSRLLVTFFPTKNNPREGRPQIPTSKCRRILGSTSSRVCALPGVLS